MRFLALLFLKAAILNLPWEKCDAEKLALMLVKVWTCTLFSCCAKWPYWELQALKLEYWKLQVLKLEYWELQALILGTVGA